MLCKLLKKASDCNIFTVQLKQNTVRMINLIMFLAVVRKGASDTSYIHHYESFVNSFITGELRLWSECAFADNLGNYIYHSKAFRMMKSIVRPMQFFLLVI